MIRENLKGQSDSRVGRLKNKETVEAGIDQAVGAFIDLFEGKNDGKIEVKLA